MERIIIREQDISTNLSEPLNDSIAFIPGFAIGGSASVGELVPCNTIEEFNAAFGTQAPTFPTGQEEDSLDQLYPTQTVSAAGFPNIAGAGTVMFAAGHPDPSYIYARELLLRGLPVIYVRMNTYNNTEFSYNALSTQPEDWTTNYTSYYEYDDEAQLYVHVSGESAPTFSEGTYFKRNDDQVDITVENAYKYMAEHIFINPSPLDSKGTYNVKFITSGGYPAFEHSSGIASQMVMLASRRGDAKALIDHTMYRDRPLTGADSVYEVLNSNTHGGLTIFSDIYDTYADMFTPGIVANLTDGASYGTTQSVMPASFAYLCDFATAVANGNEWMAISGVARGQSNMVSQLYTSATLTTEIAESYTQDLSTLSSATNPISINPIVRISNYGFCIWGNRTLRMATEGRTGYCLNFANVRALVCDVKKLAYRTAQKYMFETNNDTLFVNFKADMAQLLDRMVSTNALFGYQVLKLSSSDKSTLKVNVRIAPTSPVEKFDITLTITNDETEISE